MYLMLWFRATSAMSSTPDSEQETSSNSGSRANFLSWGNVFTALLSEAIYSGGRLPPTLHLAFSRAECLFVRAIPAARNAGPLGDVSNASHSLTVLPVGCTMVQDSSGWAPV